MKNLETPKPVGGAEPEVSMAHETPSLHDEFKRPISPDHEYRAAKSPEEIAATNPKEDEPRVIRPETPSLHSYEDICNKTAELRQKLDATQRKLQEEHGDEYDYKKDAEYLHAQSQWQEYFNVVKAAATQRERTRELTGLIDALEVGGMGGWEDKQSALKKATEVLQDEDLASSVFEHSKDGAEKGEEGDRLMAQALKDADRIAREQRTAAEEGEQRAIIEGIKGADVGSLKQLIDYLNKARQGHKEALGVYRYVLNAGAPGSYPYPGFLKERPDLKDRFDYGMNKPYKAEAVAAHDLIDFLATEAEAKIRGLEEETVTTPEKPPVTPPETEKPPVTPPVTPPETEKPPVIPPEEKKKPYKKPEITETGELPKNLDEARADYIKARRLYGNVARGGIGRMVGRSMELDGERVDLSKSETLEKFRVRYESELNKQRKSALAEFGLEVVEDIKREDPTITPEDLEKELNLRVAGRMVGFVREEDSQIDTIATTGIEKNKLKTWWRKQGLKRLGVGLGMTAIAFIPVAVATGGAGLVAARAAWGAAGSYTAVEATLERKRILGIEKLNIGHRGIIDDLYKATKKGEALALLGELVSKLPKEDVAKELAMLRVLRIEKGVALKNAGRDGAKTSMIVESLLDRESEFLGETAEKSSETGATDDFRKCVMERLENEMTARHKLEEKKTDKERINKVLRKSAAVIAAGLSAGLVYRTSGGGAPKAQAAEPTPVAPPETPPPDAMKILEGVDTSKAKHVWDVVEMKTNAVAGAMGDKIHGMKEVVGSEGRFTHVIDAIKDKIQAHPGSYGLPANIDQVTPDQLKEFAHSDAFNQLMNESLTSKAMDTSEILAAADLGKSAVSSIESHNAFYDAVVSHTPGVHFDQEMYNLMDSAREFGLDPAHATELIKEAHTAGVAPEAVMNVLHTAHDKGADFSGVISMLHETKDAASAAAAVVPEAAQTAQRSAEAVMEAQRGLEEVLRGHDNYRFTNQVTRYLAEHNMSINPKAGTISIDYQGDGVSDKTLEIFYGQNPGATNNVSMIVNDGKLHVDVADAVGKSVSSFDLAPDGTVLNMEQPGMAETVRAHLGDLAQRNAAHDTIEAAAQAHVEAATQHTETAGELMVTPGRFANKLLKTMEAYRGQVDALNTAHTGSSITEKLAALPAQEAAGSKGDLMKLIMEKTSVSKAEAQKLVKPLHWIFDKLNDGGVKLTEKDTVKSVLERIHVSK